MEEGRRAAQKAVKEALDKVRADEPQGGVFIPKPQPEVIETTQWVWQEIDGAFFFLKKEPNEREIAFYTAKGLRYLGPQKIRIEVA